MSKKKVFAARNFKDFLPNLPLKKGKEKKENQSFFIPKIKVFLSQAFWGVLIDWIMEFLDLSIK
jgi:hypothetical protein